MGCIQDMIWILDWKSNVQVIFGHVTKTILKVSKYRTKKYVTQIVLYLPYG